MRNYDKSVGCLNQDFRRLKDFQDATPTTTKTLSNLLTKKDQGLNPRWKNRINRINSWF